MDVTRVLPLFLLLVAQSYGLGKPEWTFVPLSDPSGNATFTEDQFEKPKPFYGCHFDWYLCDHEKTDTSVTLIFQATTYENDYPVLANGYVQFFVTLSTVDVSGSTRPSLKVSGGLGVTLRLVVHNMNMKVDKSRIGLSLMAFTNTSINKYDMFVLEDQTSLANEEEPGNFKSAVLYLDRREPEPPANVTYPPAYLYWKSVCYVEPQARPTSARRVTSFRATRHTKDKDLEFRISIPRALFGDLFNPNQPTSSPFLAIRHLLLSFGTPFDGYYAKTGHMEWTFVLSMGEPPPLSSLSLYPKLFVPLIIPLLAIVLTLLYLFIVNRYLPPAPSPEDEVTRPLIADQQDDEEVYRTFVLSMGEPPMPRAISLYPRLFAPLVIPLLAIVLTLLYLFIVNRYFPPAPSPEEEITRPLIEDLEEEEVYRFAQPTVAEPEQDAVHSSSTYGAI